MTPLLNCLAIGIVVALLTFLIGRIAVPEFFNQMNIDQVKSSVDGKEYNVQSDLSCPSCASDLLAEIHLDIEKLFRHLQKVAPNDQRTQRLLARYKLENVYEGRPSPGGLGDTSYTLNKGKKVVYCIRSGRDNRKIHEKNVVLYTVIHELSHICGKLYDGHGEEFQANFKWLLQHAVDIGVYQPEDYRRRPKEFCGIMINSSILY